MVQRLGFLTAITVCWFQTLLTAADFNMDVTASGIRLGNRVSGVELQAEQLKNRVVLLEFWGVKCPPCLVSMPKLEQLHKELGPMGLVVVGAHAQGGPVDAIRDAAMKLGVTFPIVENAQVQNGSDFSGIPHCMLFDHEGKCLFRGSPFDVEPALRAAVQNAPAVILEGRKLEKLAAFNDLLRNESSFSSALKKAKGLAESKDPTTAEEARFVTERISAYGEKLLSLAKEGRDEDPVGATNVLKRVSTIYRGSTIGTEAAELQREWKKDSNFQSALKGAEMLVQLQAAFEAVAAASGNQDGELSAATAENLPVPVKRKMAAMVRSIRKTAPDSKAANRATEIASQLQLDLD